jgi:hypothetical protein
MGKAYDAGGLAVHLGRIPWLGHEKVSLVEQLMPMLTHTFC